MSSSPKPPNHSKPSHTRRTILLGVLAILIIATGGTGYYFWKKSKTPVAAQSSAVQTATVTRGNIKLFASGTGTLVSPSQATFGFRASGQVTQVLVKVGDVIDAGQLLARLDDTTAQAQYTSAVNALEALTSPSAVATAQQALATDQVNITNYRATLAYLISPDVVYWTEQVALAEQALTKAQADATANTSAADAAAAIKKAQAVLTANKNALAQATLDYWNDYVPETFLTVIKSGRTTTKQVIPPTTSDVAKAWADYDLAKQSLVDDQNYLTAITTGTIPAGATGSTIAAFQSAQQAVATAKTAVDDTNLYSPIHGTIMSLGFAVGDTAGSSSTITVANLDQPYTLEIFLDQSDWTNIQVGYPVEVTFDLLPNNVYTGKVLSIDPSLTSTNGSLYVHAYIQLDANVKTILPFGTSASVDVIGGQAQNVLLVPIEALHLISPGQYAVFVMVNGKPEVRMVEVGLQDATHAEIKSGLNAGDVVSTGITVTK
ncbi:MAG: HlyD family efflux transporter periplasmic adaptor subunit [Anaerolineales bacterium]